MKSQNQECTFALIYSLIEDNKIAFKKELLAKISSIDVKSEEKTSTEVREQFQYGTELAIKDNLYKKLFESAKEVIAEAKVIIEE
ncbi:MAG: hypothetical protein KAK00_10915 [Nanoarchaeota archaeon]|nr:hypothetical protein [Nanoarchaeota archaeon]